MAGSRVLIIEDERALTEVLAYNLQREGYEVVIAHDGEEGLRKAQTQLPDLIILDLMLPVLNGLDVCREIRAGERTKSIPIVMLTAKAEETDQVVGFSMGADDYVTKPFSVKVLLQRIKALQRRIEGGAEASHRIEHAGISVDRVRHRALVQGKEVELTPTEFRLLKFLIARPERVHSRAQLLDKVWGDHVYIEERTVDVHIRRLRLALQPLGCSEMIETVRGSGYRLAAPKSG